jgi:hypothetical protein
MTSVLTKSQTKTFGPRAIAGWGNHATLTAEVRYDDECGNGHNSFAITGEIRAGRRDIEAGGMLHDEIRVIFPELAPFLKWHLTSSDGPMHYIANTTYWANQGNLENARSCAVWPDATLEDLKDVQKLKNRLPALLADFQKAVEALGFTF